jgi:hypothetical protein
MAILCMKLIAIATLSVCIALLCLSQSESLSQLAQLELDSVRTQPARPCHVQLSRHLLSTLSRLPEQFLFLLVQGGLHSHWPQHSMPESARLRERGSTLCLCNTNHPAGPRIRKHSEDGPVGAGGAWPVRPAAPAAAPGKHIVCYGIVWMAYRMLLYCIRRRSAISYVLGDVSQRHRNLTYDIV